MRIAILIIVFLAVVLVGSTYFMGMKAEEKYDEVITNIAENNNLDLEKSSYERGLLSSKAVTVFKLKFKEQDIRLKLNDTIIHGPIRLASILEGDLAFVPGLAHIESSTTIISKDNSAINTVLKKIQPIKYTTDISLTGDIESKISVKPTKKKDMEGGLELDFGGLKGALNYNSDLTKGFGTITMPLLTLSNPDGDVVLKDMGFDFDIQSMSPNSLIPLGRYGFYLKEFAGSGSNADSFQLKELEFDARTSINNGNLSHKQNATIEEITFGEKDFGPASYGLAIRKIDANAWEKLQTLLNENDKKQSNQLGNQNLPDMMALLPELLKNSPELELTEFSFKTDEGRPNAWAKIYIDGSDPEALGNIFTILGAINAEFKSSIPAADLEFVLEEIERNKILNENQQLGGPDISPEELDLLVKSNVAENLQRLVEQEIFEVKDDIFSIEVSYIATKLTVNGKDFDLPMIQ